jgi:acetyl esterase/lipase
MIVRYNVTVPRLSVVAPPAGLANGTAAVICPGGGFHFLSMETEGFGLARQLAALGVTCFVLTYRLIETPANQDEAVSAVWSAFTDIDGGIEPHVEAILPDGTQAIRLVRERAAEFGIASDRIVMIGFSAGGRLTASTVLEAPADARPNAAAVFYLPMLGTDVVAASDAPPLFILAASDDQLGTTGNEELYRLWRTAGRPVEFHMYAAGGHGFGTRAQNLPVDTWPTRLIDWLASLDLVSPPQP